MGLQVLLKGKLQKFKNSVGGNKTISTQRF